ncbi:MAG TPA: hypothetical protein PKO06_21470, partial [Candidatus Ozemobacteraceae bacterium]|nr:hypothetical protein [Candidatus Ozemobacteraceae bacterium]
PNRTSGGAFDCTGVTFVKTGEVEISFPKVKGKGLIVANWHMAVKSDIEREGALGETSLGLIARLGRMTFHAPVKHVEAACFSNFTPINQTSGVLKIDGNMIVNHFDRREFNNIHVFYNGPGCRTSLLSVARDVGKYEPKRYHVALGNQWSRFEYEKQ